MRCWVSEAPPAGPAFFGGCCGLSRWHHRYSFGPFRVGVVVGGVVVFENCTVDASIFLYCVFCKCVRAHGGCLGIESR